MQASKDIANLETEKKELERVFDETKIALDDKSKGLEDLQEAFEKCQEEVQITSAELAAFKLEHDVKMQSAIKGNEEALIARNELQVSLSDGNILDIDTYAYSKYNVFPPLPAFSKLFRSLKVPKVP